MNFTKEYKKALRASLKRIRTGKELTKKQYDAVVMFKEYLNTKDFKIENFDYHLKNNTKEYKKLGRLHLRFQLFCQALNNNVLVYGSNKRFGYIK